MKYAIALIIVLIDQWTKYLVMTRMEIREMITIIPDFLYLTSHRNPGAAWGILPGEMWFFYIVTVVVSVFVVYYLEKYAKDQTMLKIGLLLVLGGAIGNFIDRVRFQEVVDFIDVVIFSYDFPIFNIADASLVIGTILIGIATIRDEVRKDKS